MGNVPALREASNHFYRSILFRGCGSVELALQDFSARHCPLRWRQLLMVSAELGRYIAVHLRDVVDAAEVLREASGYLEQVRRLPYFRRYVELGSNLHKVHDTNLNQDFFPQIRHGPIWPSADVPLAQFLEDHYAEFLEDLQAIRADTVFSSLHSQNTNAGSHYQEFGPRRDDWQTVYLVRGGRWNELGCRAASRTCELLRSRREITDCSLGNSGAGFLR